MELRNFRRDFKEAAASQVEKGHNRIRFALAGAILFSYLCSVPPALAVPPPLAQGPGGPILIVGTPSNPFSYYYAEILRAEGMNEFAAMDLADVTPSALAGFDIAILGQMPLTAAQATMFMNWVNGGGNLIAMRP
ncbi:MAG: hypothetical protein JO099_23380, partial [Acidobacteriia bacterium]|nr:hypothetical protein [Terriglobia bacterium]